MKKIKLNEIETIQGGNIIDGACNAAGVGTGVLTVGTLVKWAGRAAFRSVLGGPVGWALGAVDAVCLGRAIYNQI